MLEKLKLYIKVIPFINTFIYLCCIGLYFLKLPDYVYDAIDQFVFLSPIQAIFWLCLSTASKFCKWHKLAILVPLVGVPAGLLDTHLINLGMTLEYANATILCLLSILTIFCGIKVLWRKQQY